MRKMKLLAPLIAFLLFILLADAALAPEGQKSLVRKSIKHRRMADDLRKYHNEQRKIHKNYMPRYPDEPVYVYIDMGTPPRTFMVSDETGIDTAWLLDKSYPGRDVSRNQTFFDPNRSSTAQYVGNFTGFSGNMEVSGDAYEDVFSIFPGFESTQRFGVVKDIDHPWYSDPEMPVGAIGSSWNPADKNRTGPEVAPILNFFATSRGITRRIVTLFIDGGVDHVDQKHDYAVFTQYGDNIKGTCQDDYLRAPLIYQENSRSLEFLIDSFQYNGQNCGAGAAKVDSGVPTLLFSYAAFLTIYSDIRPDFDYQYGIYTVPCSKMDSLPDFVYTISGQNLTVPSSSYVVDLLLEDDNCALSIDTSDEFTTAYVLGTPFFTQYCLQMDIDNTQIGFSDVVPRPNLSPKTI